MTQQPAPVQSTLSPAPKKPGIGTLSATALSALIAEGEVLEQSRSLGPKVVALPNNEFLKLLRVKHRFSTWGLINPAKYFVNNSLKLKQLGIPTLTVTQIYQLPDQKCWAVRYDGLEGTSIRHLLRENKLDEALLEQLVVFVLHLHDLGIYFRGLHPGNILLCPNGQMGLIDILDCRFRRHLYDFHRRRNFRHFFRYEEGQVIEEDFKRRYWELRNKP